MQGTTEWILTNWFELVAATLGLFSIVLQIKQNSWYWLICIAMVSMYIAVYIDYRLYADMLLQIYYLFMSLYGWWSWKFGGSKNTKSKSLKVTQTPLRFWPFIVLINLVLFVLLGLFMSRFTNSDVPWIDSFVTAVSFIATWLLARKKIENWILWIIADSISIGLYFYKGMYPTLVLFIVLTILAFVGYHQWKKDIVKNHYD